ncbi:MAG: hypothetical protein RR558_07470, partial [Coprobacillus sp.]
IVKNIDICKNDNYADINSLSKYIIQDWKSATSPRIGLQEYYISNDSFETQKEINNQINQFIQTINQYINI